MDMTGITIIDKDELGDHGTEMTSEWFPRAETILFKASVKVLAELGVGTICGECGNKCYQEIAKKYPDVMVKGCLNITDRQTTSVSMLIGTLDQGYEISDLARAGGGSLRFEDNFDVGPVWAYFESE